MTHLSQARIEEAAERDRRDAWASSRGYRPSEAPPCIHGLRHGRCAAGDCPRQLEDVPYLDHQTMWRLPNGGLFLLSQPYLDAERLTEALAEMRRPLSLLGLVVLHGPGSDWYYPGHVLGLHIEARWWPR